MSAVMQSDRSHVRHATPGRLARAWHTLVAAATRRTRLWTGGFWLVLACFACAIAYFASPEKSQSRNLALIGMVALGTIFIWAGWFARLVMVERAARHDVTPGATQSVRDALALATVVTVALPSVGLCIGGVPLATAVATPLLCAAFALNWMLLPRKYSAWFSFAPIVFMHFELGSKIEALAGGPMVWIVLAIAATALSVWCWHRLVMSRSDVSQVSWGQSLLYFNARGASGMGIDAMGDSSAQNALLPRWMTVDTHLKDYGPSTPVAAIRSLLGALFRPLNGWRAVAQIALAIGVMMAISWLSSRNAGEGRIVMISDLWFSALRWVLFIAVFSALLTYPQRIGRLLREPSKELAELALLPGLGSPANRNHALLVSVLRPAMVLHGIFFMVAAVATWRLGLTLPQAASALLMYVIAAAVSAYMILKSLAGRLWSMGILIFILMLEVSVLTVGISLSAKAENATLQWLMPAACVALVGVLWRSRAAWQRVVAQPHPFLLHSDK